LCIARRSGTPSKEWHLLSINPLTGSCLSRRSILQYFLSKFEEHVFASCSIVFTIFTWWVIIIMQKQKWRFPLLFSTLSTNSNYLWKINRKKYIRVFLCDLFVIHPLKTKRTVCTARTVHVCHWVLITAVKLLKIDFTSDTTVLAYGIRISVSTSGAGKCHLTPPHKTSRVRWRHDFPSTTFVQNCIYFAGFWS